MRSVTADGFTSPLRLTGLSLSAALAVHRPSDLRPRDLQLLDRQLGPRLRPSAFRRRDRDPADPLAAGVDRDDQVIDLGRLTEWAGREPKPRSLPISSVLGLVR